MIELNFFFALLKVIFVVELIFFGLVPINFFMAFRKKKNARVTIFFLQIVDVVSGY